jgi:large subunit ribosomal protein L4
VRSQAGGVTGSVSLDPAVFEIAPKGALIHQVVTAQLAAARAGTHSTRTRAEVAGGGAKPYRQKGTGRARQGSIRAPHYKGGGIALGPKPRAYRQHTPKKMVRQALCGALSDRAASGRVVVVDAWAFEVPSTSDAKAALEALGVGGRTLVVLSREDEKAYKSFRNIPWVEVGLAGELSAYDVLCADWLVFTRETLPGANSWAEVPAERRPRATKEAPAGPAQPGEEAPAGSAQAVHEKADEEGAGAGDLAEEPDEGDET